MKLVKSLLLGSAAGIVAVGSAVAADLPVRKAAPVDYVQVCSAFGTGYFYIPGTDTCLRVGGFVRYESRWTDAGWSVYGNTYNNTVPADADALAGNIGRDGGRDTSQFNQFARGSIQLDARTATEFGTLRSYAEIFVDTGSTSLDSGFIEFAGLTLGKRGTYFRGFGSPIIAGGQWMAINSGPLAAYTADLGPVSLTISAESDRDIFEDHDDVTIDGDVVGYGFDNASSGMPDFVAAMRYSDGGFTAHLAGALTEIRSDFAPGGAVAAGGGSIPGTTYGYALTAGVSFEALPTTTFTLQGAYSVGAHSYLGLGQADRRFELPVSDAYLTDTGSVKKTEGWVLNASVNHAWTPQIAQILYGSYGEYKAPAALRNGLIDPADIGGLNGAAAQYANMPNSFSTWSLGTRVDWTPVAGLTVSGDVNYVETAAKNRVFTNVVGDTVASTKKDDRWTATLRVQRSF